MKVLILCLFVSVLLHGVALFLIGQNKPKTIYPVELQFAVVEVTTNNIKKSSIKKNNTSVNSDIGNAQNSVIPESNIETVANEATIELQTSYPEMSRLRGEEEEIKVQVFVSEVGKVEKILFEVEPKYPRLKKAVLEAISKATFEATKSVANLKFNFKLK
jgi:outer membrane biosynthesis protein TonB